MAVQDFLRRHRRKFAVALGLAGSAYWIVQYVSGKLREWQERLILERLAKDNLERRFEQNQKDATFTIMALLPTVSTQILERYDIESIKQELQALRSTPAESSTQSLSASQDLQASDASIPDQTTAITNAKSKSDLWDQIKLESLTRVFTLLYSSALLILITRIQLNILGRRAYVESVRKMTLSVNNGGDLGSEDLSASIEEEDEVNRQFLTFSWWLLHRGWQAIASRVERAVADATVDIDARTQLGYPDIQALFGRIQFTVEHPGVSAGGSESFLSAVLPPPSLETYVLEQMPASTGSTEISSFLRSLLDETADVIDSPNTAQALQRLVHVGLSVLTDRLAPLYASDNGGTGNARLASALASITRQAHQIAAGSPLTNDYIDAMVEVPELDALCAVIYSNY